MNDRRGVPGAGIVILAVIAMLFALRTTTNTHQDTPTPTPHLVDVNVASEDELRLLPGIGPTLAARIVEDRVRRGWFTSVDDLDRVHRIGPVTVNRLRAFAIVHPRLD